MRYDLSFRYMSVSAKMAANLLSSAMISLLMTKKKVMILDTKSTVFNANWNF